MFGLFIVYLVYYYIFLFMKMTIVPYACKRLKDSNTYEVAWNEWDGGCMCSRLNKRGTVDLEMEEGFEPSIVELEKAIRLKYHGNN